MIKLSQMPIYDVTGFNANVQDLTQVGFKKGLYWDDRRFFSNILTETPGQTECHNAANFWMGLGYNQIALDIEDWVLNLIDDGKSAADASIAKFVQIVGWMKEAQPTIKIGTYGAVPWHFASYQYIKQFRLIQNDPTNSQYAARRTNYINMQAANVYLKHLADVLDFVVVSGYVPSDDYFLYWSWFMTDMRNEARQYNIPCYAFIHPCIGGADTNATSSVTPIQQLRFLSTLYDAVGWWLGYQVRTFDPTARWYTDTLNFIQGH